VPAYVTDAIVIHARRYGEADRLVTLFTIDKGKISAIANSARKPKSRLRGASEPFVVARFEMAEGKSLDIIRSAEIIDPNLKLRESWKYLQLAGHVAEIANKITVERFPDPDLYGLLIGAIKSICEGEVTAVIQFKADILNHMGVFPDLTGCANCGSGKVKGNVHLDIRGSGFLCDSCASEKHIYHPIGMEVLYILDSIRDGKIPAKSYDRETWNKAEDILTILIQGFMQSNLKTATAARHVRSMESRPENKPDRDINSGHASAEPENG
jgi:DNA repair protein RecO (recombination protein O)